MRKPKLEAASETRFAIRAGSVSRRDVLVVAGAAPLASLLGTSQVQAAPAIQPPTPLRLLLSRPSDGLYAEVEVVGFRLSRSWFSGLCLTRTMPAAQVRFHFGPQHFTETTIPVQDVRDVARLESFLSNAAIFSSKKSKLVFQIPEDIHRLELKAAELLDWTKLAYVAPDLSAVAAELNAQGLKEFVGIDWSSRPESAIEFPWGIYLQPLGYYGRDYLWRTKRNPRASNGYTADWFARLENARERSNAVQFEILDISAVQYEGYEPATRTASFRAAGSYDPRVERSPITNYERLELASTFSRRFPYDRYNSSRFSYAGPNGGSAKACYVEGRAVTAGTYSIGMSGGSLDLKVAIDPKPGCGISAWESIIVSGRDQYGKITREGFLYPFGIPAQLVVLTEKVFVKDAGGHYVAPLAKQAFIQTPQPNEVEIPFESPFGTISVLTKQTPPLDLPSDGDASAYATCDYFLPIVGGSAYNFEITGTDRQNHPRRWSEPLIFVSNKVRDGDGLIPEPGYGGSATRAQAPAGKSPPMSANRPVLKIMEPVSEIARTGGLWDVDQDWMSLPFRFAKYGGEKIALALSPRDGEATQETHWIEWTRGKQPIPTGPEHIAPTPFIARARTIKLALSSVRQFAGKSESALLVSYRDLRLGGTLALDPEPTKGAGYYINLLDPSSESNSFSAYLYALPLGDSVPLPRDSDARRAAINSPARLENLRQAYFGLGGVRSSDPLLYDLDLEARFGISSSSTALGGLTTPDSPVGFLTIRHGPVGDNANASQPIDGSSIAVGSRQLRTIGTLRKQGHKLLYSPFSEVFASFEAEGSGRDSSHRSSRFVAGDPSGQSLSSYFGLDAEIIPGFKLLDVLSDAVKFNSADSRGSMEAAPPTWKYKITGVEALTTLFGQGIGQIRFDEAAKLLQAAPPADQGLKSFSFGISASVSWTTSSLKEGPGGGLIKFVPRRLGTTDAARLTLAAGTNLDLLTGRASASASAQITDFSIAIFDSALEVDFRSLHYALSDDGSNKLDPQIATVRFGGALAFIENLKGLLSGLFGDSGIKVDMDGSRIRISQTISIPPVITGKEPEPLYIGPAQITNLSFQWGVSVPTIGRDALSVSFGLSSREFPFVITVMPYGGKAYALMDITTRGIRLFEVSFEYGGILDFSVSIARGTVSLTAGFFFAKTTLGDVDQFDYAIFAKLCGSVTVANIIRFDGLIAVNLHYVQGVSDFVEGVTKVTVSARIGFFRVSYSFEARRRETIRSSGSTSSNSPKSTNLTGFESRTIRTDKSRPEGIVRPFEEMDRRSWTEFVEAYAY